MAASETPHAEADVAELERRWAAAFAKKDISALQKLMADGYNLVIAVEGMPLQVVPRNAWLESLDAYSIEAAQIEQMHVRVYGNVAVTVLLWRQEASLHGRDRSARFMLTDVWVKQASGWKLAERHSSRPEHPGAARPPAFPLDAEID